MLTADELAWCRATHEEIMLDRVRLYRSGRVAEASFDPALGYEPSDRPEPYYDGKAIVQARPIQAGNKTAVEQPVGLIGYAVKPPYTVTDVNVNDLVEVVESPDPGNVGLWLVVQAEQSNTFATARRLLCTLYEGPVSS
jgi:hypothetical protein